MSDLTAVSAKPAQQKLVLNQVNFYGKIVGRRQHESFKYTQIVTAAADSFSKPSQFEVRSKQWIGQPGELVNVTCDVNGFVRPKRWTDRKTGVEREMLETNVYFDVTE